MAISHYDPEMDDVVHLVQDIHQDAYGYDDSDMETISSASTAQTTSTITSDEIGDYFREAYGRTYAHDENLPMLYPIDEVEARRHEMQHVFLKALVHGNYIGPVPHLLRPRADGSRPRILDIRTCTGNWCAPLTPPIHQLSNKNANQLIRAQEMAAEFPHCDIVSIDIAPIVPHAPRPNITFEIYDLYAGVAEPDESFDYVSCRHIQLHRKMQVKEYDRLIFDLHRVLKPGGLITICEVENQCYEAEPPFNTYAYVRTMPAAAEAIRVLKAAVIKQGINIDAVHHVHEWLQPNSPFWGRTAVAYDIPALRTEIASRGFRDIQKQAVLIPVGRWHPDPAVQQVGDLVARGFALAWKQLEPAFIDYGSSPEEANRLCSGSIAALENPNLRVVAKYHMVYATKN
ncbi:Methyltransferase domain [Rhizoctonia solani]|uniref:Methyltransferase domain n=1 Tax=Rhizoctonia solani TaxID=456999 RepID=A0A8H7LN39_9AGAM|nr:Methyltransferase domain [Rhizoctonia solani]